jgi:hypothetical protein
MLHQKYGFNIEDLIAVEFAVMEDSKVDFACWVGDLGSKSIHGTTGSVIHG